MQSRQWGSVWNFSVPPKTGRRPEASRVKVPDEPLGQLVRHLEEVHLLPRAGRALHLEVVAVVGGQPEQRTVQSSKFTGIHTGPRQLEFPPNIPLSESPGT